MSRTSIKRIFSRPSALQLASSQLKDAEMHRLEAMMQVEYYQAIEKMYRDQVARLKHDIAEFTAEYDKPKAPAVDPSN